MRFILTSIYYLFFAGIAGITILLLVSLFPIEDNYQVKAVLSGSMEPAIHTGSVVFIKPEERYTEGDIITFGKDTRTEVPVTHRIIGVEEEGGTPVFVTQGDANEDPDSVRVEAHEVIGRVFFTIPYLGYVLDFAKQPIGFLTLIIVPSVIVVVGEVRKIITELRRPKERRVHEEETHTTL